MGALSGAFCALTVAIVNNGNCILHRPGDDSNATCALDRLEPSLLLGPDPACGDLDLDAGEDGQAGADHGLGDGDGAPADQVSGSARETEGDETTGAGIGQRSALVPERPHIGVGADRQADLLLEGGLGISHACLGGRSERA